MKPLKLEGRAWKITDASGTAIDDIDTDMIFHNSQLHITERAEMAQHAFGNLEGWKDFPAKAQASDVLIVGKNFGCGSSRQQAVDCFLALGVAVIIGESFGAIYKRNCINAGLPLVEAPGLFSGDFTFASGDTLSIDLERGLLTNAASGTTFSAKPMHDAQKAIYLAGDLFAYGRTL
jgi:3-isopropylmalate/(R)-2-methylmalate dehydratase small subunit